MGFESGSGSGSGPGTSRRGEGKDQSWVAAVAVIDSDRSDSVVESAYCQLLSLGTFPEFPHRPKVHLFCLGYHLVYTCISRMTDSGGSRGRKRSKFPWLVRSRSIMDPNRIEETGSISSSSSKCLNGMLHCGSGLFIVVHHSPQ